MKALIAFALMAAGSAFAGTFTYTPATDGTYTCTTYCSGYVTSDPAHKVNYVNVQFYGTSVGYRVTVSVDGRAYAGYALDPTQLNQLVRIRIINGVVVYGSKTILASEKFTTRTTCVVSGRGQHCTTWYRTYRGSVKLP